MTSEDARKAIGKPELLKLQQVTKGLKVGRIFGERVLVEPVTPETEMDRLEREGTLFVPKDVKKNNTPMESTGIVVELGTGMLNEDGTYKYELRPGMMVMFNKWGGTECTIDDRKFRMLDFREIACTLEATGESLSDVVQQVAEGGEDVPVTAGQAVVR